MQALWSALLLFQLLPTGFSNRNLRENLAPLLGLPPDDLDTRPHDLPSPPPASSRNDRTYSQKPSILALTDLGLRTAWFFTRAYSRILRPGLGRIMPELSAPNVHSAAASINSPKK